MANALLAVQRINAVKPPCVGSRGSESTFSDHFLRLTDGTSRAARRPLPDLRFRRQGFARRSHQPRRCDDGEVHDESLLNRRIAVVQPPQAEQRAGSAVHQPERHEQDLRAGGRAHRVRITCAQ